MYGLNGIPLTLASGIVCSLLVASAVSAQGPDMPAGRPTHLQELDYLIGEWTVRSFSRDSSGKFVEADQTTSYRARPMYDGLSILAEFYDESRDGFYSVHLISRASDEEFVHYYLNARLNRRIEFRGRFEDGEYNLTRVGGYGGGDFLYKETDSNVEEDSFVKRIYRSDDGGASWVEGNYYFLFERVNGSGIE